MSLIDRVETRLLSVRRTENGIGIRTLVSNQVMELTADEWEDLLSLVLMFTQRTKDGV